MRVDISLRMRREIVAIDLAPRSIWGHLRLRDLRRPTAAALFRRGLIRIVEGSETKLELTEVGREILGRLRAKEGDG